MDKLQLEQYIAKFKEWLAGLNFDFNLDLGSLDLISGIISIAILFLTWSAFKLGVQVGKESRDYNHRLEILARIAKIFHETHAIFDEMNKAKPEEITTQMMARQADKMAKLSNILRKDIAMWSITAPTSYLAYSQKLADQFEKTSKELGKSKPDSNMSEKKLRGLIKKQHTPVLSTYEGLVKAMRSDIRGGRMDKIIKQIIHG